MGDRMRAPVVEIQPDVDKILAASAYIIHEAGRRGVPVTQYDIVKTIFLADRRHLNDYGRPVVFDNYAAMIHGPVPSLAYDFLKENAYALRSHRITNLPWRRRAAPQFGERAFVYFDADFGDEVRELLSESDIEALSEALTAIKSLSFQQIRRLTHEDAAYKEAWQYQANSNTPISYGLLFDTPDYDRAEILSHLSRHQ